MYTRACHHSPTVLFCNLTMALSGRDVAFVVSLLVAILALVWPVIEDTFGDKCPFGYGGQLVVSEPSSLGRALINCRALHRDGLHDVFVGASGRISAVKPSIDREGHVRVIHDCAGRWIAPGFVDAHVHALSGGVSLGVANLRDASNKEEFVDILAREIGKREDGWVVGHGWDETRWGGEIPNVDWLDERFAGTRVWAQRVCGHVGFASSEALEEAGLGGNPSGILKESEMSAVVEKIPRRTRAERDDALRRAFEHLLSLGITTIADFGDIESLLAGPNGYDTLWEDFETLERWDRAGDLPIRVTSYMPLGDYRRTAAHPAWNDGWTREDAVTGIASRTRIGGVKAFLDGSLGGRTAAFLEAYDDDPTTRGELIYSGKNEAVLIEEALASDSLGLQVAVHAIGDAAVVQAIKLASFIEEKNGQQDVRRFRIEHSQHLTSPIEGQPERLKSLGAVASVQPAQIAIDEPSVAAKLGYERARRYCALRTFANHDVPLAGGSDWPIVSADVFDAMRAAVIREREALTAEEAMKLFAQGAAFALRLDGLVGTLASGAFADFIILDGSPADFIVMGNAKPNVLGTFVGGKCAYGDCTQEHLV